MVRNKKSFIIYVFLFVFGLGSVFAQNSEKPLSQGEKLFKENKPKEAVQVLENELLNGVISANTYNFLGLAYYQLENYAKSVDAFKRGIENQPTNLKILSFNLGNTYYAMKDYKSAISCYSTSLKEDPQFYDALLNRANALLMGDQLGNAKGDYEDYLVKCPESSQKNQIERLIKALEEEMLRRAEEERLLAEQNKALWEEIDPKIVEADDEETKWEKIDASIAEEDFGEKASWENVDASIGEHEVAKKTVPWEKVENAQSHTEDDAAGSDAVASDNLTEGDGEKVGWEAVDSEKISKLENDRLYIDDSNFYKDWEDLSEEELLELKRLERESRVEYEKWLEEQSLIKQRQLEEELKKLQQQDDKERLAREQLLEDMMKAEEARRKKLLEDVANSLLNGDSTNMSSGADELIEYDQEGELD